MEEIPAQLVKDLFGRVEDIKEHSIREYLERTTSIFQVTKVVAINRLTRWRLARILGSIVYAAFWWLETKRRLDKFERTAMKNEKEVTHAITLYWNRRTGYLRNSLVIFFIPLYLQVPSIITFVFAASLPVLAWLVYLLGILSSFGILSEFAATYIIASVYLDGRLIEDIYENPVKV